MGAAYTVMVVQLDGVPRDVGVHGTDLNGALAHRDDLRRTKYPNHRSALVAVYDADDPERGYFDWPEEEAAS